MKYLNEIEKLLKDLFFEDWMDENDWKGFLSDLQKATGKTIESMSNEVEIGINNGHSLEEQIKLIKLLYSK